MQITITEREAEALIRLKRLLERKPSPIGFLKLIEEDYLPDGEHALEINDIADELAILSSILETA